MTTQPEALVDVLVSNAGRLLIYRQEAAAELRRLYALNQELREALNKIATVSAMDYEYQNWARSAIAKHEGQA